MKKKIISVLMTLLMVAMLVPLGIGFTNASAADPYDVLIWSPSSVERSAAEEAEIVESELSKLNLNHYKSFGNYTISKISQTYDLNEVKFIMVYEPGAAISSSDLSFLSSFLESGGHIMFVGENCTYFKNTNDIITTAVRSLGFNITFSPSYNVEPSEFTVSVNSNSDLFKNTTQFSFAAACRITGTDNATEILSYNNQVCFVGKQIDNGYISVVSDCNFFNYSTESNIKKLLQNCYNIGSNSTHNYESVVTAPTCTEQGYTTYTCTDCGYSYQGSYVDALGHDIGVKSITEPTCTTDGVKEFGCLRCDAESTTVLLDSSTYPQSLHNYSNNMSQIYNFSYPGADKLILTFSSSTEFESNYDYLYIYDNNGNQIGKYTGTTLASKVITIDGDSFKLKLTSDGSYTYYGFSFSKIEAYTVGSHSEILPATGHDEVTLPAVEATCSGNGLTEGKKCSKCGEIFVEQKVIEKLGHSEVILPAVKATCSKNGLTEGKKCSVCGEILIEQKTVSAKGHTRVTVAGKAPTCLEDGFTDSVKCSVCNEILVKPSVLKASHSKTTIPAKAPTCEETGLTEGVKCSLCNEILIEQSVVEKIDHIDENSDGYCDTCAIVVDQAIIEANCECRCHDNDFFYKIVLFFQKLFGINRYCVCGKAH